MAEFRHDGRGQQGVTLDVADGDEHPLAHPQDLVEVAADLDVVDGRLVPPADRETRGLGELRGQQAPLQGEGDRVFLGVRAQGVDRQCQGLAELAQGVGLIGVERWDRLHPETDGRPAEFGTAEHGQTSPSMSVSGISFVQSAAGTVKTWVPAELPSDIALRESSAFVAAGLETAVFAGGWRRTCGSGRPAGARALPPAGRGSCRCPRRRW